MTAYYSSLAMVTATVLYLVAVVIHSLEWASARGEVPADARDRRQQEVGSLQGATARAGAADGGPARPQESLGSLTPQPAAGDDRSSRREERQERLGRLGLSITLVAVLVHVAGVVLRGVAAERAPWGNMYEFVTSSLAMAMVIYLVGVFGFGLKGFGLPVTLLASVGLGLAVTVFYVDVAPLMPALHSVWFLVHIVAAALAGAVFNLGAIAAALYLLRERAERKGTVTGYLARLPESSRLDQISYRLHAFAFPLWTFTVAAGAIWAQYAWGRFWNWDPKETWSLVTWIVYAAYLHARATAGWKGRRAAILALLGLATFWWNFVGVNLLVPGLHSYAGI